MLAALSRYRRKHGLSKSPISDPAADWAYVWDFPVSTDELMVGRNFHSGDFNFGCVDDFKVGRNFHSGDFKFGRNFRSGDFKFGRNFIWVTVFIPGF